MTPKKAFGEWWREEGKDMKFYAGGYIEHRGIAKEAYLAATKRAAGIAENWDGLATTEAFVELAKKIRGE